MGRKKRHFIRSPQSRYAVQIPHKIFSWLELCNLDTKTEFSISVWVDKFIEDSLHDTRLPLKKNALKLKKTNATHLIYLNPENDRLLRFLAFHTNFSEEEIILNVVFDMYCLNTIDDHPYERELLVSEFNGIRK